MRLNSKLLIILSVLLSMMILGGCSAKTPENVVEFDPVAVDPSEYPVATIELETGEELKIALFPEIAPNTVNNFIALSQEGFYDGLAFHRVIKDFMIQGGDPLGTGMGGPGYTIKGEFSANGFPNGLKHTRGVVSMARTREMDTAGSQFFIVQTDYKSLDEQYASFGYVFEGIEVVDRIAEVAKDKNDKPLEAVIMKSIMIELNGYEPAEVIKN
ncbi:MAG: peptidylprolyl isomerase [Clostridiales bacterium]|nr:peptidylprolyl isomerase [Clostridiales bacterium]